MTIMGEPQVIAVAGDWHGEPLWAMHAIREAGKLLPPGPDRIIVHVGDFGFCRDGDRFPVYLRNVSTALGRARMRILVADGNHEDHAWLAEIAAKAAADGTPPPYQVLPRVWWLPRGFRWTWAGRTWVALGGATSVNRAQLTEGWDWFPEEAITAEQAAAVMAAGPADVMVTHDAPSGVHLALPPPLPDWELADLARAGSHRDLLQGIGEAVQPAHWMHGHLHVGYSRTVDMGWGPVQVTGLAENGSRYNMGILSVAAMTWRPAGL